MTADVRLRKQAALRLASAWLLLAPLASVLATAASPHELLERMNQAVQSRDYEGRFVIQTGDRLDALYIVHRVDDGVEKERVVSLTGRPREIVRSAEGVACLFPGGDSGQFSVRRDSPVLSFSPLHGVSGEQLATSYRLAVGEAARVAGRDANVLIVEPNDDLRYGHRLYIDDGSSLPLRSVMVDTDGEVVSQMMFVELRVDDRITPIERDLSAMQRAQAEAMPAARLYPTSWSFDALPTGFQLNAHRRSPAVDNVGDLEHFIFSDGLASVSVYVHEADDDIALEGVSQMGQVSAFGRLVDGYQVVVVGEVPARTLTLFASRIRPKTP